MHFKQTLQLSTREIRAHRITVYYIRLAVEKFGFNSRWVHNKNIIKNKKLHKFINLNQLVMKGGSGKQK